MGTNSVAVFDTHRLRSMQQARGMVEPLGFVPTELMPLSLAFTGNKLYIATNKGTGTGPNNAHARSTPETSKLIYFTRNFTYAPSLLYGSLATLEASTLEANLATTTQQTITANRLQAARETIPFAAGRNPIHHVIYIIKENRTYDQVFGDLTANGHPVGNGDPTPHPLRRGHHAQPAQARAPVRRAR